MLGLLQRTIVVLATRGLVIEVYNHCISEMLGKDRLHSDLIDRPARIIIAYVTQGPLLHQQRLTQFNY